MRSLRHQLLAALLWVTLLKCTLVASQTVFNLKAKYSGETYIFITWDVPISHPNNMYELSWRAVAPFVELEPQTYQVNVENNSHNITNLHYGTMYEVILDVTLGTGNATEPEKDNFITVATNPSPIRNLNLVTISRDELTVNWKAPEVMSWNAVQLSSYRLCWSTQVRDPLQHCSQHRDISVTDDSNELTSTIVNLSPLTNYFVSVRVTNSGGKTSTWSPEQLFMTAGNDYRYIQLRLLKIGDCYDWLQTNVGYATMLTEALYVGIRTYCNCNFIGNGGSIDFPEFSCRSSADSVVFRARVVTSSDTNIDNILAAIQKWRELASLSLNVERVNLDQFCQVSVDSPYQDDCAFDMTAVIAGSVVAAIVLLIVIIIVGVVVAFFVYRYWKNREKKQVLSGNRGFEFGALDQPEEEEGHNFVNTALETIAADDEQPHSKVPKLKKKTGHFSPTNPKDDETENDPENSTSGGYNFNNAKKEEK